MIEREPTDRPAGAPDTVIEPEAVAPSSPRRRRRAVLAGLTALALAAGGIAVTTGGRPSEPEPLALMAGDAAGGRAESTAGPAPAALPAIGASADRSFAYPSGGWGLRFEVAGDLPELAGRAPAWRATGPALDRAAIARIATTLGLAGTPVERDGGWSLDGGDWTLAAYPGGDAWSVNLFRNRSGLEGDDPVPDDPPAGPALSAAEAERKVRELLEGMGIPGASWVFETTATEIGIGWACAAPAPAPVTSAEELRALEAEKLRSVPADLPAPDGPVTSCPPPPAPVPGFNVALYPQLDGLRAAWPVWQVTLRSDGLVESLHGSWVRFERAEEYKLRGVSAALKELQSPAETVRRDGGVTVDPAGADQAGTDEAGAAPAGAPGVAVDTPGVAPGAGPTQGVAADAPAVAVDRAVPPESGAGVSGSTGSEPSLVPLPPEDVTNAVPAVVTITGVELGLLQMPVFEGGKAALYLVPAYRFMGRFENGTWWETSVIALHPDAIAPPPDVPVADDPRLGGTGTGGTGTGGGDPVAPPVAAKE